MNPTISKKNQNFHKLDYVCFNKIKSIPKKNIISKKSFNNLSISNYNNSIEIDAKLHSKYRKINRHSQQKPILSERIKRNYSNGNKKGQNNSGTHIEQNSIYKIISKQTFEKVLTIESMFAILYSSLLREVDTARQCESQTDISIILALRRRE